MAHGDFVWCDLASHAPDRSRAFYAEIMGWHFEDVGDYSYATKAGQRTCGIFEMPAVLRAKSLPPFWMSYVRTNNIDDTVDLAIALGGRVEIEPTAFDTDGYFALIRDPLGAGFCVYEGPHFHQGTGLKAGHRGDHGLFVSDPTAVSDFYAQLFGWTFSKPKKKLTQIITASGATHYCHQIDDKGSAYWTVLFAVADIGNAASWANQYGATSIGKSNTPNGWATLIQDPSGAMFGLIGPRPPQGWSFIDALDRYLKRRWGGWHA